MPRPRPGRALRFQAFSACENQIPPTPRNFVIPGSNPGLQGGKLHVFKINLALGIAWGPWTARFLTQVHVRNEGARSDHNWLADCGKVHAHPKPFPGTPRPHTHAAHLYSLVLEPSIRVQGANRDLSFCRKLRNFNTHICVPATYPPSRSLLLKGRYLEAVFLSFGGGLTRSLEGVHCCDGMGALTDRRWLCCSFGFRV